ncbi:hypothetical protein GOODEAATRI_017321, partial [Goodea atripinnis]
VENVRLLDRSSGQRKASVGTLYLSATHTIFIENNPETRKETWEVEILLPLDLNGQGRCPQVSYFSQTPPRSMGSVHTSTVTLMEKLKLVHTDQQHVCVSGAAQHGLQRGETARHALRNELYCLSFNPNVNKEEREESWNFIDLQADYKRMGVPNNLWVSTVANSEYRVCDTYPAELFVPKSATPAVIVGSSGFRSRGRFPALSYFHQDTLVGLNAMANKAAGKGYENEDHYNNIKLHFIGIENIHVMRSSQQKIIDGPWMGEMRAPTMTDFLWGLENSGWLKHIKAVLDAGVFIAKVRTRDESSSTVLIERDWVSFGHKFSHRYAHLDGDPREVSPVIDQFLECVWQLSEQFPCAFEFNERFLIAVHTHVYSCQYGTFLGNCEKERRDIRYRCLTQQSHPQVHTGGPRLSRFMFMMFLLVVCRLRERSHSVWPQLWKDRSQFSNPLYKAELSQSQGILRPNTTPYCFKMWKGLYNHVEKSTPPRQSPADFLSAVREESHRLEEELTNHQERIAALTGKPIMWEKMEAPRRRSSRLPHRHSGPDPPTSYSEAITNSELQNSHLCSSELANQRAQRADSAFSGLLGQQLRSPDVEDVSACSDLESGVADLSSRSSCGGDDSKDPELE